MVKVLRISQFRTEEEDSEPEATFNLIRQIETRRAIDDIWKEGKRIVYLDDKNVKE